MHRFCLTSVLCVAALVLTLPALNQVAAQDKKGKPGKGDPMPLGKITLVTDSTGLFSGPHLDAVSQVFFTPDNKQLITVSGTQTNGPTGDRSIRFWDLTSGEMRRVLHFPGSGHKGFLKGPTQGLHQAALAPAGETLAVSNHDYVSFMIPLPEGRVATSLNAAEGYPLHYHIGVHGSTLGFAFSPGGKYFATASYSGGQVYKSSRGQLEKPAVYQFRTGPPSRTPTSTTGPFAFSPNGELLHTRTQWMTAGGKWVDAEKDESFVITNLDTGKVVARLDNSARGAFAFAWSPDGKTIAAASKEGIFLYEPDGKLRGKLTPKGSHSLMFSKDSRSLLIPGRFPCRVDILDAVNGELTSVKPATAPPEFQRGSPQASGNPHVLSPDGELAAVLGLKNGLSEVMVWRIADGTEVQRLAVQAAPKTHSWPAGAAAAWSTDGKALAWGTDRSFHLTELQMGPPIAKENRREAVLKRGPLAFEGAKLLKDGKETKFKGPAPLTFLGNNSVVRRHVNFDWLQLDTVEVYLNSQVVFKPQAKAFQVHPRRVSVAPSPDDRYLMTASADGSVHVYDPRKGTELLALHMFGNDWIIQTPEGYYAASPGGEKSMAWRVDNGPLDLPDYYPLERFRKTLHRPDVIKLVLEKGSVVEALKAANAALPEKDRPKTDAPADLEQLLPPRSSLKLLQDAGGQVTVQVNAEAQVKSQPVVALRLLLDGRPLPEGAGYQEFEPALAKASVDFTLTLPPGTHTLSALARSEDASALSAAITVGQVVAAQQPVLHLLAVGINEYQNGIPKLNCAVNDAKDLAKAFLLVQQGNLFRDVKTHTLLDKEATAPAIRQKLAALRPLLKNEDVLVVFFAGHGVKEGKDFFLLTVEADPTKLATTALSGSELSKELRELRCQVLLLLDACHSSAVVKNLRPATDDAARAFADDEVGVTVLAAAMGHQKALEKDGNGYFTAALKAALAGEGRLQFNERDGRMYVRHLYTYVADVVANRSEERQHPFLSLPSTAAPVALRQFGKK